MILVTRYDFPVPEWSRVIYTSEDAKQLWEPRIKRIAHAWDATERASVGAGGRHAALQNIEPSDLPQLQRNMLKMGLVLGILERVGVSSSYASGSTELAPDKPWAYRVVITLPEYLDPFTEAYAAQNNDAMGTMLGFPKCCREFFERTWVEGGWSDTTWMMALNSRCHVDTSDVFGNNADVTIDISESESMKIRQPVECNILLRWIGVRWVTHLPCSFSCEHTRQIGIRMRATMIAIGFEQEAKWMDELLDSPMEWSGYHGIAEIVHPVLKVSAKTDATREKLAVRRPGRRYPEAGAKGLGFPFERHPAKPRQPKPSLLQWLGLRRTPEATAEVAETSPTAIDSPPIPLPSPPAARETAVGKNWERNGFSSLEAMDAAHRVLQAFVGPVNSVIDLGCGDGTLARRLVQRAFGVEMDFERATEARKVLTDVYGGTIYDFVNSDSPMALGHYEVALISANRFREMSDEEKHWVASWLRNHASRTVVYDYDFVPPKVWWL